MTFFFFLLNWDVIQKPENYDVGEQGNFLKVNITGIFVGEDGALRFGNVGKHGGLNDTKGSVR